ncbi:MAG TPA: hypothetical protein HA261_00195 [Methanosarcina sp.]|nr:hypothetical protein [Methanosarcina sp.]
MIPFPLIVLFSCAAIESDNKSSTGVLLNVDINGAIKILRKVVSFNPLD